MDRKGRRTNSEVILQRRGFLHFLFLPVTFILLFDVLTFGQVPIEVIAVGTFAFLHK